MLGIEPRILGLEVTRLYLKIAIFSLLPEKETLKHKSIKLFEWAYQSVNRNHKQTQLFTIKPHILKHPKKRN